MTAVSDDSARKPEVNELKDIRFEIYITLETSEGNSFTKHIA